jgi:hypothetical protein
VAVDANGIADYLSTTDINANGIPDAWELENFGNLDQPGDGDYDGDGVINRVEYNDHTDPNSINFAARVSNNHVMSTNIALHLEILSGTPSYRSVLVDNAGFTNASWTVFSSTNLPENLPATQGWHEVWVGLRGMATNSQTAWQWSRLKLDTVPPQLCFTIPTNRVSVPLIQLTGYCTEALSRISYNISNAAGTATNQLAVITGQFFDTTTREFTTNDFHCYDVPLTNGVNVITLHAVDLAGNRSSLTTNITFVPSTNPPAIQLLWPWDGMSVCGEAITIKGRVDDPTADVFVFIVDADGNTNRLSGRTGRDGIFWVENVPLIAVTNNLFLTASTPAGQGVTNITLIQSSIGLTINTVLAGQTQVSGNIGAADYTIWVNGVEATQTNGDWTATITPICIGGGQVAVAAIPNSDNGGHGTGSLDPAGNPQSAQAQHSQTIVDAPEGVFVSSYHNTNQAFYLYHYMDQTNVLTYSYNMDWLNGRGGTEESSGYIDWLPYVPVESDAEWPATSWPQEYPYGTNMTTCWWEISTNSQSRTTNAVLLPLSQEHCDIRWAENILSGWQQSDTEMKLATGGPLGSKQMNLWAITASTIDAATGKPIPYDQTEIGSLGNPGTDGNLHVMLPDNDPVITTPNVQGNNDYKFNHGAQKFRLMIKANGISLYKDTVVPEATFCVGQKMQFELYGLPSGIICSNYQWTFGGTFVNAWTNSFPGKEYPECSRYYLKKETLFRQSATPTNWWLSGAFPAESYDATVSCDLIFTNGNPTLKANASGKFGMIRPVPTFFAEFRGAVSSDNDYFKNELFLHFGGHLPDPIPIFPHSGIVLWYNNAPLVPTSSNIPPSTNDTYGYYYISQINKRSVKRNVWFGTNQSGMQAFEYGLDEFTRMNNKLGMSDRETWADSPGMPLGAPISWVSCDDTFEDYLMFKPNRPDEISIPLFKVTWGWSGAAKTNGLDGAFLLSGTTNPITMETTMQFPYWTNFVDSSYDWTTTNTFYETNN